MVTAIYPGTFDPVHNGHVDVAGRASKLFDKLIIGIYDSPPKNLLFSTEERVEMFSNSVMDKKNIDVIPFSGLAVDFAIEVEAGFILRGLGQVLTLRLNLKWHTCGVTCFLILM